MLLDGGFLPSSAAIPRIVLVQNWFEELKKKAATQ
jgi:hypothetical protein